MSGATTGQSEQTDIGRGFIAMGDGLAVQDPLTPSNRAEMLRSELRIIESQLRHLQQRHSNMLPQLERLEAGGV